MKGERMETRFLQLTEGRIAYDDTGGGGPLVLAVPGLGDVRGVYRFTAPALAAAGYRVVTMDVRGHGESSVGWPDHSPAAVGSDIVALIRHLGAGRVRVLGGSMAAGAAVWAAAEAPDAVAAIVLIGPFGVRDVPVTPVQRLGVRVVGLRPAFWSAFYRSLYPTSPPSDLRAYRRALKANLAEPGRMAALRAMLAARGAHCGDRIPEVRAPALVVMGTKDPDFPDPRAEAALVADLLSARTLLVEGAGHYPLTEMPEQVLPELLAFLEPTRVP